jgi:SAM-dependent methyltransferase
MKPPELLIPLLRHESVTATNGLMRRGVVESLGGYEEGFRGMYEDQVFYTKMCLNAPVFVASKCWYRWRKHPRSACAVAVSAGKYESSRLVFLKWLRDYLSQQGIDNGEIRNALHEEILKCRNPALFNLQRHTRLRMEDMKERLKSLVRQTLPRPVYRWLRVRRHGENYRPTVGEVSFGSLRRMTPISRIFGFDRGQPIDRYYIEGFLARNAVDVGGRVLEVGDDTYTRRFGGDRVTGADVLYVSDGNPRATIIADLSCADHIPSEIFDCIILTQTLHLVYDVRAAVATLRRILKPGGVLLATFPGISQIDHYDWGGSWYWAFTALSARRLFEETFSASELKVETHGNVLTAIAFLQGLATEELRKEELDYNDADYQVTIAVRAVKGAGS